MYNEKTVWSAEELRREETRKNLGDVVVQLILKGYHVAEPRARGDVYKVTVSLPVYGGVNLNERNKDKIGNDGRASHIYCAGCPDGNLYWGNIADVLTPDRRREDMAEWLRGNATRKIGIRPAGEIAVSDPSLHFWDRFVTVIHTPMQWKTYVGQVDVKAEFAGRASGYRR